MSGLAWRCREACRPSVARCPDLPVRNHRGGTQTRRRRPRPTAAPHRRTRVAGRPTPATRAQRGRAPRIIPTMRFHGAAIVPARRRYRAPERPAGPCARTAAVTRTGITAVSSSRPRPRIPGRSSARYTPIRAVAAQPKAHPRAPRARRPARGLARAGVRRPALRFLADAPDQGQRRGTRLEAIRPSSFVLRPSSFVLRPWIGLHSRRSGPLRRTSCPQGDCRSAVSGRGRAGRVQRPAVRLGRRPAADLGARRLRAQHHHPRLRFQGRGHRRVRHRAADRRPLRANLAAASTGDHRGRGSDLRGSPRREHDPRCLSPRSRTSSIASARAPAHSRSNWPATCS